jgi:DegV family protein with EDD domain
MLRIVTDGAADMPVEWEAIYQIDILPLHVQFGNETYTQGPGFTQDDFYRMVKEKRVIPKTSLPSIGEIVAYYQSIAKKGDTILSIHISRKLSGTFATVESAARELVGDFNIIVFDSGAGSVAQAFLAREARCLEQAGASIQDILRRLEHIREQWTLYFTLDTLEYAYLSGRISAMQSLLGAALQVKPVIVLREGLLDITSRVRTRRRALEQVIQRVQTRLGEHLVNLAVVHAADPATAQQMLVELKQKLQCKIALITDLAIPVAANLGPGAIGIIAYPVEEES